jgi:hypothetical protein
LNYASILEHKNDRRNCKFKKISWMQVLTALKFYPQEIEDKKFNAPF